MVSFKGDSSDKVSKKSINTSVTLVTGSSGRGKTAIICKGIVTAIETDVVDIFLLAPSDAHLQDCLKRLQQQLPESHVILHEQSVTLETVRDSVAHKVRLLRFDQPFCKYDVGLLCVLEVGRLAVAQVNKILSYNPKVIWGTSSIAGALSAGSAVLDAVIRPMRTFCGVGESVPSTVEEDSTASGLSMRRFMNKVDKKTFSTIKVTSPLIHGREDSLEASINAIFCLTTNHKSISPKNTASNYYPAPSDCDFFYVNKETLFSGHDISESFLCRLMDLYTSFDRKRTASHLRELVDDPSQHLFCLQQPVTVNVVPQILTVLHISLENSRVRIVNLTTNSKFQRLGYARRTLNCLHNLLSSVHGAPRTEVSVSPTLCTSIEPNTIDNLPRLLTNPSETCLSIMTAIEAVSCQFEASGELLLFWKKCAFVPVDVVAYGDRGVLCTMIRSCGADSNADAAEYIGLCQRIGEIYRDSLSHIDVTLAHEILFLKNKHEMANFSECSIDDLRSRFDGRDLRKLDSFVQNTHTFESVQDLVYHIASIYFSRRMDGLFLPKYQELTLVGFGLQLKSPRTLASEVILADRYRSTGIIDPFSLHKDVQKEVPLLLSHVRECVRVFLNLVTKVIEQEADREAEEAPAKRPRLI